MPSLPRAPIVDVSAIHKQYGSIRALAGVDLKILPGEIYGLLGPNGAGKSTMIKIIAGLVEPTEGQVRVLGLDPSTHPIEVKSAIGYVSENPTLYDSLSPRDFFEFVASVRRIDQSATNERVSRLTTAFGLDQYYDSPIATLSMGTKQKISIIASLLHEPPLLLLDEPLNGLDARSSRIVKDLISLHAQTNMGGVLFSTHILEVAEHLCNRIGIIYQGKLVAEGSLDQLRKEANAIAVSAKSGRQESVSAGTLEEVFLKLTHEEDEIAETLNSLRSVFRSDKRDR